MLKPVVHTESSREYPESKIRICAEHNRTKDDVKLHLFLR